MLSNFLNRHYPAQTGKALAGEAIRKACCQQFNLLAFILPGLALVNLSDGPLQSSRAQTPYTNRFFTHVHYAIRYHL